MKFLSFITAMSHFLFFPLVGIGQNRSVTDDIPQSELNRISELSKKYYGFHLNKSFTENTETNNSATASHVLFTWPLRANAGYDDIPGYYMTQNYVDYSSGFKVEWNCGQRTYNGHNGVDINIWPFWWDMMDRNYVRITAAAAGVVVTVRDNINNDHNCSCDTAVSSNITNNIIAVMHSDSSISYYYHIKTGSAKVAEGDIVKEGQTLAIPGSSGCSSNPHLHFEVHTRTGALIDPWVRISNPAQDCNTYNEETWWQDQKPYYEPQILRVMTHSAMPKLQGFNGNDDFCPGAEDKKAKNRFNPGEVVRVGVAVRDLYNGDSLAIKILRPDGTSWYASGINPPGTSVYHHRYYDTRPFTLPSSTPAGTYIAEVDHYTFPTYNTSQLKQRVRHFFTVGCETSKTISSISGSDQGYIVSDYIKSTATVPASGKVTMQAGNYIQLTPGFSASAGTTYKAKIRDCNYTE